MRDSFNSRHRSSFKKAAATARPQGQRWIPAPALSHRARSGDAPRTSFPLCLVCDEWARDGREERGRGADDAEDLARQFEANSALLKELDDSARLSGDRQRLRVMRRLWEMDGGTSGQKLQKWHDILKAEASLVPTGTRVRSPDGKPRRRHENKGERSNGRKRRSAKAARKAEDGKEETEKKTEIDQKNLTESMSAKMVEKDGIGDKINREELLECLELIERSMASSVNDEAPPAAKRKEAAKEKKDKSGKRVAATAAAAENDSTDVSQSLRDEAADNSGDEGRKTESDFFIEVIIDELKKENRDLKFDLMARERQLEKAAEKVKEVLDENARLAKKLDKAVARAQDQAEVFVAEARAKDQEHANKVGALEERIKRLECREGAVEVDRRRAEGMEEGMAVAEELRLRLAESERKNANLEKYVDEMKRSYEAVFGDAQAAQGKGLEESTRDGS